MNTEAAVDISQLNVSFQSGAVQAVKDVSMQIPAGSCVGLVGESGSGKSTLGFALGGLLRGTGANVAGSIRLAGSKNVIEMSEAEVEAVRGRRVAYVFQEPMTSLNPLLTIGRQLMKPLRHHLRLDKGSARRRAVTLLDQVELTEPDRRLDQYPHEMSGGMRQRIVLAIALSLSPDVLVADEPTTALDVTVQAQVLTLLKRLNSDLGMSVLFVSHDLNVVGQVADIVVVMREGQIVETGPTHEILTAPKDPYTMALLSDIPRFRYPRPERGVA